LDPDPAPSALFRATIADWKLVLGLIALGIGIGIALIVGFFSSPTYRSTVVATSSNNNSSASGLGGTLSSLGGLASLAGIAIPQEGLKTTARNMLESKVVARKLIEDVGLLPELFPGKWSAEKSDWKVSSSDYVPTLNDGALVFLRDHLTVEYDSVLDRISVTVEWGDATRAAYLANQLVSRVNSELQSRAIAQSQSNRDYLEKELTKTTVLGIREAISRLDVLIMPPTVGHVIAAVRLKSGDSAADPESSQARQQFS
jgi:uncharacterized protein involved in exopolysaccharide biosynthesis